VVEVREEYMRGEEEGLALFVFYPWTATGAIVSCHVFGSYVCIFLKKKSFQYTTRVFFFSGNMFLNA